MSAPRELQRLERLMDVVYALVLWRVFMLLPRPEGTELAWRAMGDMLMEERHVFIMAALAVVVMLVYWRKNIELFRNLRGSDKVLSVCAILQVFTVLLFLYVMRLGMEFEADEVEARILESVVALLMGLPTFWGWRHALKNPALLDPDLSRAEGLELLYGNLAAPVTALLTIPCALLGPVAWQVGWLCYPLIVKGIRLWYGHRVHT